MWCCWYNILHELQQTGTEHEFYATALQAQVAEPLHASYKELDTQRKQVRGGGAAARLAPAA